MVWVYFLNGGSLFFLCSPVSFFLFFFIEDVKVRVKVRVRINGRV